MRKRIIFRCLRNIVLFVLCAGSMAIVTTYLDDLSVWAQKKTAAQKKNATSQGDCPPSIPNCGKDPKDEPKEDGKPGKGGSKPKPISARPLNSCGTILFDRLFGGILDWGRTETGAIAQGGGLFTLYNEFCLETKSPELLTIQLQTPKQSANWQIWLSTDGQRYEQLKLDTTGNAKNGFVHDTATWKTIPADGKYRVQVRYAGVAATNTKVVESYDLLVSRIRTITLEGGDSSELSDRNARKLLQSAEQVAYFKEFLFDAVNKGSVYSVELLPKQLAFEIFSEDDGQQLHLNPKNSEHLAVTDVLLADSGKYRLRIIYRNAPRQGAEIPYYLKFTSQKQPRATYLSETQMWLSNFKPTRARCDGVIKSLQHLTRTNQKEPEAHLALGQVHWLCAETDQALREIEKGFSYGGILTFNVFYRSECERRPLENGELHKDAKNKPPAQLRIQKGRFEIEACRKLTGQRAEVSLTAGDMIIQADLVDGPKRSFYFAPETLEQLHARMIADLIKHFAK